MQRRIESVGRRIQCEHSDSEYAGDNDAVAENDRSAPSAGIEARKPRRTKRADDSAGRRKNGRCANTEGNDDGAWKWTAGACGMKDKCRKAGDNAKDDEPSSAAEEERKTQTHLAGISA